MVELLKELLSIINSMDQLKLFIPMDPYMLALWGWDKNLDKEILFRFISPIKENGIITWKVGKEFIKIWA
jgi:hypothetical protein